MNQQKTDLQLLLIQSLDELVRLYRGLLETVRREKEILISSQLDDLNENNRTKEAILLKIQDVEKLRQQHATDLGKVFGVTSQEVRLQELARLCQGEVGDRLRNFQSVLEILLKRVQELNKENEVLVQSALTHITGAMKSIRETLQEKPTYQRKGEVASAPASTGHLVSREA